MAKIDIIPTVPQHVRELGSNLRKDDERELLCLGFPHKVLWRSYKNSFMTNTAFVDGKIAAIWGLGGTPMGLVGNPWLVTTEQVNKISPLAFARIYQQEVEKMIGIFPTLVNYVHYSYNSAIRLLDIIGFDMYEPQPLGEHGEMFIKFEMAR